MNISQLILHVVHMSESVAILWQGLENQVKQGRLILNDMKSNFDVNQV